MKIICIQTPKSEGPDSPQKGHSKNENQILVLVSSGDEDILIYPVDPATGEFGEKTIFKRPSYTKVLDFRVFKNEFVLMLLDSGQIEISKIMTVKEVKNRLRRKTQRKVKDLPEVGDFLSDFSNYFKFMKNVSVEDSYKSIYANPSLYRHSEEGKYYELYLFSNKNHYQTGSLNFDTLMTSPSPKFRTLTGFGHEQAVKYACLSSEDSTLLTISKDRAVLWDAESSTVLKHLDIQNAICGLFLPRDKHVVIGDVLGQLWLVDVLTGQVLDVLKTEGKFLDNLLYQFHYLTKLLSIQFRNIFQDNYLQIRFKNIGLTLI